MEVVRVKVRLIGEGTEENPYRVPLPTYQIIEIDYERGRAVILIPDDEVKEGRVDRERIREKYREWYRANREEFEALEEL